MSGVIFFGEKTVKKEVMSCTKIMGNGKSLRLKRDEMASEHGSDSYASKSVSSAKKKVIVVGAGIAGLAAAVKLCEYNIKDVLVLEAMPRIGGRIDTLRFDQGFIELGASWLHGEEGNVLYDIAKEQSLICNPNEDASVEGEGHFYTDHGEQLDNETVKDVIMFLDGIKDDMSNGCYASQREHYSAGHIFRLKFEEFVGKKRAAGKDENVLRGLFNWYMKFEKIDNACVDLEDVSIKSYSEWSECQGVQLINFKTGFKSIIDLLAKHLPQETVKLNKPVIFVDYFDDNVKVTTEDGDHYEAEHLIVTCSIGFLKDNFTQLFSPPFPKRKSDAINNVGFGTINKIYLQFDEPFWSKQDLGFQIIWTHEEHDMPSWVYDISGFDVVRGQPKLLLCWIGGIGAEAVEKESEATVASVCTRVLNMFLKNLNVSKPSKVIASKWHSNKYVRGAYSHRSIAFEQLNLHIDDLVNPILKESFVNGQLVTKPVILFAGEATDQNYYSTTHGALLSGLREAQRIIDFNAKCE